MTDQQAVYARLDAASGEVREAAGRMHQERVRIDQEFRACVGTVWTGRAAASFLPVFDDWNAGLNDVEEGLAAMAELIDAAKRDVMASDAGTRDQMSAIASRIVDRLGG